jgi:hypothetical protein
MSQPTEDVEGQALAQAVIDALDQGRTPDWEALDHAYREPLLRQAAARLRRLGVEHRFTPEDALHDFLVRRVYPAEQARAMFTRPARGERPLRGRLLLSLARHCAALARSSAAQERSEAVDLLASAPERPRAELPPYEEMERLVLRQLAAIRAACPLRRRPHGAACCESLLVRFRLDWAAHFDGIELRRTGTTASVVLDLPLLEQLTPWTEDERAMPLVEGGATLEQLWQQARQLALDALDRKVGAQQLAPLVPVHEDVWNQWISRGRLKLRTHLGEEYDRLFAIWGGQGEGL